MKHRLLPGLSLIVVLLVWVGLYLTHPAAPLPLGPNPDHGWWDWFDQGQYLKISQQWVRLDFFNPDKYYPPLYPGLVALLWPLFRQSSYLVFDLTCSMTFFLLLTRIFSAYLQPLALLLAVGSAYGFHRQLLDQWVIPWTTHLSSLLIISLAWLLLLQHKAWQPGHSGRLHPARDLGIALAICSAMLALRPFEILPSLLLSFGIARNAWHQALIGSAPDSPWQPGRMRWPQWIRAARRLTPALLPALLILALYATVNLLTFGSIEPSYSKEINSMGFNLADLPFKYASLVNDSSPFGTSEGHLTHLVPWYPWLIAAVVIGAFRLATPIRYLTAAALLSQASYLSFNDLVPTGLFTFNNIHYATWSIAVIGAAAWASLIQLYKLPARIRQHSQRLIISISAAAIALLGLGLASIRPDLTNITIRPPDWQSLCRMEAGERGISTHLTAVHIGDTQSPGDAARMLNLMLPTESNNDQIHTAHASRLALRLNGETLTYRRDWRLVGRPQKDKTLLAILLQKDIPLPGLLLELEIGADSNIVTRDPCRNIASR